jgi:Tol biopolymer transport system component
MKSFSLLVGLLCVLCLPPGAGTDRQPAARLRQVEQALSLPANGQDPAERRRPTGPYLGQTPPGTSPRVFAPGLVSTDAHEFSCSFSPDGTEFYFTRRDPVKNRTLIMVTTVAGGAWTEPAPAPFGRGAMEFEPMVTPDGQRLYYTSDQPVPGGGQSPMNIWFVRRQGTGWADPTPAGSPFNPMKAMYVSMTRDLTIYTTDISQGPGSESIVVARPVGGQYPTLERLGPPVNSGKRDMYPYIAPDERYLVFVSGRVAREGGLFVSYRQPTGTWSEPRAIDLGMPAGLPTVSPDGKYLFFTAGERGKSDIYWVDAAVLRPTSP